MELERERSENRREDEKERQKRRRRGKRKTKEKEKRKRKDGREGVHTRKAKEETKDNNPESKIRRKTNDIRQTRDTESVVRIKSFSKLKKFFPRFLRRCPETQKSYRVFKVRIALDFSDGIFRYDLSGVRATPGRYAILFCTILGRFDTQLLRTCYAMRTICLIRGKMCVINYDLYRHIHDIAILCNGALLIIISIDILTM